MAEKRFCKDCKWMRIGWVDWLTGFGNRFARCAHPTQLEHNDSYLVTGKEGNPKPELYCSTQRNSQATGRCGAEGRLYEAKEVATYQDREAAISSPNR